MTSKVNKWVTNARVLAVTAHRGETRRDGITPYSQHLEDVASLAHDTYGDWEVTATSWLHDIIENTKVTEEDLQDKGFPRSIIDAVLAMTHDKALTYDGYIRHKVMKNEIALKGKIMDITCNLKDSPSEKQVIKYVNALLTIGGGRKWQN